MKASTASRALSVEAKRRQDFLRMLLGGHVELPETEYVFTTEKAWRLDFAWPRYKVAIESDGGTWAGGRHNTGSGYAEDIRKRNAATLLGWKVYNVLSAKLCTLDTVAFVRRALIASQN